MSRVINVDGPGKTRNRWRRTVAEALRHLTAKKELDAEARDLAALVVFGLRGIAESVGQTTEAWDKRDYYLKADQFRLEWEWAGRAAEQMTATIQAGQWKDLPPQLAELLPRFADIRIAKFTRSPTLWQGCYRRLMRD